MVEGIGGRDRRGPGKEALLCSLFSLDHKRPRLALVDRARLRAFCVEQMPAHSLCDPGRGERTKGRIWLERAGTPGLANGKMGAGMNGNPRRSTASRSPQDTHTHTHTYMHAHTHTHTHTLTNTLYPRARAAIVKHIPRDAQAHTQPTHTTASTRRKHTYAGRGTHKA